MYFVTIKIKTMFRLSFWAFLILCCDYLHDEWQSACWNMNGWRSTDGWWNARWWWSMDGWWRMMMDDDGWWWTMMDDDGGWWIVMDDDGWWAALAGLVFLSLWSCSLEVIAVALLQISSKSWKVALGSALEEKKKSKQSSLLVRDTCGECVFRS